MVDAKGLTNLKNKNKKEANATGHEGNREKSPIN